MVSKTLQKIRRKNCDTKEKETSLQFIKDALMTQVQPMFGTEIVDVDIGGLKDPTVSVTYYIKKGGSK